jgi:hypothetical protein
MGGGGANVGGVHSGVEVTSHVSSARIVLESDASS